MTTNVALLVLPTWIKEIKDRANQSQQQIKKNIFALNLDLISMEYAQIISVKEKMDLGTAQDMEYSTQVKLKRKEFADNVAL